jgi:hypothetical protein
MKDNGPAWVALLIFMILTFLMIFIASISRGDTTGTGFGLQTENIPGTPSMASPPSVLFRPYKVVPSIEQARGLWEGASLYAKAPWPSVCFCEEDFRTIMAEHGELKLCRAKVCPATSCQEVSIWDRAYDSSLKVGMGIVLGLLLYEPIFGRR